MEVVPAAAGEESADGSADGVMEHAEAFIHSIPLEDTTGLHGERCLDSGRRKWRSAQIGCVHRGNGKAPVELDQPRRQESIGVRQGRDAGHSHLLDQPILQPVKHAFDAPLGL